MSNMFDYDDMDSLREWAAYWDNKINLDYLIRWNFGQIDGMRRKRDSLRDQGQLDSGQQSWFDKRIANHKSMIKALFELKSGGEDLLDEQEPEQ
jgi:hypothetical protein